MPTSRHFEAGSRDGPRRRRRGRAQARAATLAGALSLAVGLLGTAGAAASTSGGLGAADLAVQSVSTKTTFETSGCQAWNPPTPGVYSVVALGSAGETVDGVPGGWGDQVSAEIAVTSSKDQFEVCVDQGGGEGGSITFTGASKASQGGNGGGASSLFYEKSSGDYVPVLVAAGGGGAGGASSGLSYLGGGGGAAGSAGDANNRPADGGWKVTGGGAGTQSGGGAGGSVSGSENSSADGSGGSKFSSASGEPGTGGSGGQEGSGGGSGGGGGGGYYGGGGGGGSLVSNASGAGGGGGSDYCASGQLSATLAMTHCFGSENVGASYGPYADGGSAEVSLRLMYKLPSHLVFTAEPPSSVDVETPFAVTVTAETTDGAAVSTYRSPVSLSIASGPSAGTLLCPITGDTVTPTDGVATFHCLLSTAGTYTLEASSGALRSTTSTSVTVTQGVTRTVVTVSPTPTTYGTPVTYSATVSGSLGTVTGSVTFSVNGSTLCTGQIDDIEGSASCTSAAAPLGTDTVTGTYSGSTQYLTSSGTARLVVSAVPPPPAPVTPAPVLSGIAPTSGPATGGTSVTLSGTNLCAPTSVTFGSASATVVSVNTACTQVVILDPPGTPSSTVPVHLVNAGGTSNSESFTYASVVLKAKASPVLTSLSPTRGLTSGGEDVTIDGANLCGVSAVDFGTTPATLVSTNAACTEVTVADPPGSGQVAVTLTTPVGTATTPERFDYVAPGYRLVGADGGVFDFGHSPYAGSLPGLGISVDDIVGMARDPASGGYWLVGKDGGVFAFGGAPYLGSLPGLGISVDDITGIVAAPGGNGYWLVGADGGVFAFGDAPFLGSIPGLGISVHDITGIVAAPGGEGYWLVGKDGGVFAFGDAPFLGSIPGLGISVHDITGIVADPSGQGYWLVGKDGGVFAFGDAPFLGSIPGLGISVHDITGIVAVPGGGGYWLVGADGGIFSFGDAPFLGSLPGQGVHVDDITGIETTS